MANLQSRTFKMIDNYIYFYHILDNDTMGKFVVLPTYPESISDTMSVTFNQTNILSRSAPIFSYSYSGPRSIRISLTLHRDMMTQINYGVSNFKVKIGDDYVDTIINCLQASAVPTYVAAEKMVNPPMVAVRFGNEVYIKGVVTGSVSLQSSLPLLENNKYAVVNISFDVSEIEPYGAETVVEQGSMRGLDSSLERTWARSR